MRRCDWSGRQRYCRIGQCDEETHQSRTQNDRSRHHQDITDLLPADEQIHVAIATNVTKIICLCLSLCFELLIFHLLYLGSYSLFLGFYMYPFINFFGRT